MPWISEDGNSCSQLSPFDYLGLARSRMKVNILSKLAGNAPGQRPDINAHRGVTPYAASRRRLLLI